ncbi:hypothetical protein [Deinococcus sp. YIM 77859]|uniref:hypothetical protein n=1 Tax=Deinococcus sp. YIM 77859 TaxID=1540221 RepID=UPI000A4B6832|nr:hypothetical protein [Deinococcus sp. YIM 77859]
MNTPHHPRTLLRACALLTAVHLSAGHAQTQTVRIDPASAEHAADTLFQSVQAAVTQAGGDLERSRLQLAFGFSTGHFASDPGRAEAARAIATQLVTEHLAPGDEVRAYAWEMGVYPHASATLNPYRVPATNAARNDVNRLWPRSTRLGSGGGHDTERAAVEIAQDLPNTTNAVIVLLTNTAFSVASSTQKPIGEGDARYQALLKTFTRLPARNPSGASVPLAFVEATSGRERTLDAVVFVPKTFQNVPLAGGTRAHLLRGTPPPSPSSPRPLWPLLIGVLAVVALAAALWWVRRPRTPRAPQSPRMGRAAGKGAWQVTVGGRSFTTNVPHGETVVNVCGRGYPAAQDSARDVVLDTSDLPGDRILTITRDGRGLSVRAENGATISNLPDGNVLPLSTAEYRLRVTGRQSRPNLPPRPYAAEVKLAISPLDAKEHSA